MSTNFDKLQMSCNGVFKIYFREEYGKFFGGIEVYFKLLIVFNVFKYKFVFQNNDCIIILFYIYLRICREFNRQDRSYFTF